MEKSSIYKLGKYILSNKGSKYLYFDGLYHFLYGEFYLIYSMCIKDGAQMVDSQGGGGGRSIYLEDKKEAYITVNPGCGM